VGFELQNERKPFGPARAGFGHAGAGGSLHGACPEYGIGFSYVMNRMRDDQPDGDERPLALLAALYACCRREPERAS
jgi:hypothetical protein